MFCPSCGSENENSAKFCTNCGFELPKTSASNKDIQKDNGRLKKFKSSNNKDSFNGDIPNREAYLFNNPRFRKKSHAKIYVLSLVTFGIYYFFLLYDWIKILNEVRKEKILDPVLALFITFFTCFLGAIYYDWRIAKEFELIAKEQGDLIKNKQVVKPPIQNLKAITLCINAFCLTASFISAGILWIPLLVLPSWLNVEIQKAVDYALELKTRAEKIEP